MSEVGWACAKSSESLASELLVKPDPCPRHEEQLELYSAASISIVVVLGVVSIAFKK